MQGAACKKMCRMTSTVHCMDAGGQPYEALRTCLLSRRIAALIVSMSPPGAGCAVTQTFCVGLELAPEASLQEVGAMFTSRTCSTGSTSAC